MTFIPMKVRHEVKALASGRVLDFYITDDVQAIPSTCISTVGVAA